MKDSEKYKLTYKFGRFDSPLNGARGLYFANIVRWKIQTFFKLFEKRENFSLEIVRETEKLNSEKDYFCLLGHGTILFNLNGVRGIVDPVFGDIPFYKRYTPCPYSPDELGKIDIVLITHSHYDHLDIPSLKKINAEKIFVPLKTFKYLKKIFGRSKVEEMTWFDKIEYKGVDVTFLPSKHWNKRGIFDKNTALWGSFAVKSEKFCLYFAGDTAYSYHFSDIGKEFDIDYAFLPIGAYKPDYVMKHNHMNPDEALKAFLDLKAKNFIPIHYGVFKLSDEPVSEPEKKIKNISEKFSEKILFPLIGEVFTEI